MRYYIVSWDCEGVEFLKDITKDHPDNWAKQHLFDCIKQSKVVKVNTSFDLMALKMRAMANTQRHYEIYVFTSEDDICESDIQAWANSDPQGFADWVRVNHSYKVYDNRRDPYKKPAIV
jgi:hypothetical protein